MASAKKWWKIKLKTTTTRSHRKRSFSFILMAIPRDHLASSAGPRRPAGTEAIITLRFLNRRGRRLRLRSFIADQAHFAEQFRHLHARERFEKRGHLRGNLGDVPGELVSAGGI